MAPLASFSPGCLWGCSAQRQKEWPGERDCFSEIFMLMNYHLDETSSNMSMQVSCPYYLFRDFMVSYLGVFPGFRLSLSNVGQLKTWTVIGRPCKTTEVILDGPTKCIGEWRESSIYEMHRNESIPLVRPHHDGKITGSINYGTCQQDLESAICSSSSSGSDDGVKEMYNTKICVICYDEQRNCFFVPCGHRATCHVCAQRIFHEENRKCPICRRVIGKTRRLFDS